MQINAHKRFETHFASAEKSSGGIPPPNATPRKTGQSAPIKQEQGSDYAILRHGLFTTRQTVTADLLQIKCPKSREALKTKLENLLDRKPALKSEKLVLERKSGVFGVTRTIKAGADWVELHSLRNPVGARIDSFCSSSLRSDEASEDGLAEPQSRVLRIDP